MHGETSLYNAIITHSHIKCIDYEYETIIIVYIIARENDITKVINM
jgi:hypothetical protein